MGQIMKWKELNKDGSNIDDLQNKVLATNYNGEYLYGRVKFYPGAGWMCVNKYYTVFKATHYLVIHKPE